MKIRYVAALSALVLATSVSMTGCGKVKLPFGKKKDAVPAATPAPQAVAAATPSPATPTPLDDVAPPPAAHPAVDRNAQVVVLCYHRLEGKAGGINSIEPALFEKQMDELKEKGIGVISMQDFLAWRRGEKSIPSKSVLITLDDGYVSSMEVGVPILKKHGFTATFFVYLNYINKGGKSVTWAQLGELRDQGFEIGSHTVSHQDLKFKPKKDTKFATYEDWLKDEIETSKKTIEDELGIKVATIAYPFGLYNAKVEDAVKRAGYDLAFTTYGQRIGISAAPFTIGRYDVTAKDAQHRDGFTAAIGFEGPAAPSGTSVMAQEAQSMMITEPMNGAVINTATPTLKANIATLGALDPASIKMRVSGVGLVPAQFDAKSKMLTYAFTQPLRPGEVTVIIQAKSGNQPVETKWSFKFDPKAQPSSPDTAAENLPPRRL